MKVQTVVILNISYSIPSTSGNDCFHYLTIFKSLRFAFSLVRKTFGIFRKTAAGSQRERSYDLFGCCD